MTPISKVLKSLPERMAEYERTAITAVLEQTKWNQRAAADILGVLPTTLHEKMKRLRILKPGKPEVPR